MILICCCSWGPRVSRLERVTDVSGTDISSVMMFHNRNISKESPPVGLIHQLNQYQEGLHKTKSLWFGQLKQVGYFLMNDHLLQGFDVVKLMLRNDFVQTMIHYPQAA